VRRLHKIQAIALKSPKTPKGRPDQTGLRFDPKWLGDRSPTLCSAKTQPEWERNPFFGLLRLILPWLKNQGFSFFYKHEKKGGEGNEK
jgi:hypothetical protein